MGWGFSVQLRTALHAEQDEKKSYSLIAIHSVIIAFTLSLRIMVGYLMPKRRLLWPLYVLPPRKISALLKSYIIDISSRACDCEPNLILRFIKKA